MSAPTRGFMNHICLVAEARGKMPCGDQCDECRAYEHQECVEPCGPGCTKEVASQPDRIGADANRAIDYLIGAFADAD